MNLHASFVRRFSYPLYLCRHRRTGVLPALRSLRRLAYDRAAQNSIRERQEVLLVAILQYAFDHSVWYRDAWRAAGVERKDLRGSSILPSLPIITRDDLYRSMESVLSDRYPRSTLLETKTGGSTMEPLIFYRDPRTLDFRMGIELFLNEESGWRVGEPWVNVWGNLSDIPSEGVARMLKYRVVNALTRRMTALNTTFLDENMMISLADEMRQRRTTLLFGYPRGLAMFARFVRDRSIRFPHLLGIIATAEPLIDLDRADITSAFGIAPLDRYASRELGMVSQECNAHCGLHIMTDNVFLEFLPHQSGEIGPEVGARLVATDLHNTGMPLIRYETGDVASPLPTPEKSCGCRFSGLPLMSAVTGRVTDILIRSDGSRFLGLDLPGMRMADTGWVKQIQYVQTGINEVTIRIIRGDKYSDDLKPYLQREVDEVFKDTVAMSFEFVSVIEKSRSGKFVYSSCRVPKEELLRRGISL